MSLLMVLLFFTAAFGLLSSGFSIANGFLELAEKQAKEVGEESHSVLTTLFTTGGVPLVDEILAKHLRPVIEPTLTATGLTWCVPFPVG